MKLPFPHRPSKAIIASCLALTAVSAFLLMNTDYLALQASYALRKPAPADHTQLPTTVPANRLWIPAIGLSDVPINAVTERGEDAYQDALLTGVARFPGTPEPGQPGNSYVFGHSSDYASSKGDYKTVFALLPKLKEGDVIIASDSAGIAHTYEVIETKVVWPDDFSVLDQFNNERFVLTLQTSYPLGTALQRYIVRAELLPPDVAPLDDQE